MFAKQTSTFTPQINGHVCTMETCSLEDLDAADSSIGHAIGFHACEQREIIKVSSTVIYCMATLESQSERALFISSI